ncbi:MULTISPECIES: hypothetical protein [unclassified Oscillibacter]|uniref:hypothetical protein n=1 Tax=unclassified Oscillibacter TaxID=2629304 RepID=UPI0025F421E0|nr:MULTISPECIES: hypothetical protein [unclassified Oscillibacter]
MSGETFLYYAMNFVLWLVGCLHVIGCVGGLAFFVWVVLWDMKRPKNSDDLLDNEKEDRP